MRLKFENLPEYIIQIEAKIDLRDFRPSCKSFAVEITLQNFTSTSVGRMSKSAFVSGP